jgi:hypothetical protein
MAANSPAAVSYRYTENPEDRGTTVCMPCGAFYLSRRDWDLDAHEVSAREMLAYGYGGSCADCGDSLRAIAAGMVDDAYLAARGLCDCCGNPREWRDAGDRAYGIGHTK